MKNRYSFPFIKLPETIRWKILTLFGFGSTLLFLAIFLTAQLGLPFRLYEGNADRIEIEALYRLSAVADSEKALISNWFRERLADLKFSAQEPHFQSHLHALSAPERNRKSLQPIFDELLESFLLARKYYHYEAVELIDSKTGICLFSTMDKYQGNKSLLFDKLFADGRDWEEKVVFQEIENVPSICLAYQIRMPSGKDSGSGKSLVMLYRIKTAQFLSDVIRHSEVLGLTGEIELIDRDQTLLSPLKHRLSDGTVARPLEYRLLSKPAQFASQGVEGIHKVSDYRGIPVVSVTRNYQVTPDFNLGIIVEQDEAEIFSSLNRSILQTMIIASIGLALLLTLLYLVTRHLLKPLEKLTSTVNRISKGDLEARTEKSGSYETGMLATAFNEMADEIQRWHRGFEVAVAGRTAELRKFSEVVEQSPVSIMITDIAGNIEYVNPRFSELTGYTVEEVLGLTPRILKSGETPAEIYREMWETVSAGDLWEGELVNKKKSGELFWEHAKISPIKNSEGVITGYAGIKEDITGRRFMEAQLLQSQKMEAMGTLAGGVAHDFNNILTVISGYGVILKSKLTEEPSLVAMVNEILAAEARAEVMTRSLLMFSRKEEIRLAPVDLGEIVLGLKKSLSRLIREDIEFSIEIPDIRLPVMADKGQIEQLIVNLVVNARDAMPSGGMLSLTVAGKSLDKDDPSADPMQEIGSYAVMTVADTGTGMDKKTQERIFDPFFTTKEAGKGTGLGLSMAYSTVSRHGGSIYLFSEPGKGTTFKIYLPLLENLTVGSNSSVDEVFMHGTETVLIVEDDAAIRKILLTLLSGQGYTVLSAENGEEGLELFRENPDEIRLVLTDIIMPKKNGREMCQEIHEIRSDLPVIFMSGYSSGILDDESLNDSNLLVKPIHPITLLSKIRELLDKEEAKS